MGLGRHQVVAGGGADLISDLAFNPIRDQTELFVYGVQGCLQEHPCVKNTETKCRFFTNAGKLI